MRKNNIKYLTLILALLLNNSLFAVENQQIGEKQSSSISEAVSENKVAEIASETLAITDKEEEKEEQEDISEEIKEEEEEEKEEEEQDFWIEKLSGRHLKELKGKMEELQKLYNTNYRAYRIGEAINSVDRAERQQKRNFTLIQDSTRQLPFSIYAITYIFPELLQIDIQRFNASLLETEKTITDEISETPEEIDKIIHQILNKVCNYDNVANIFSKLITKAEKKINDIKKINIRTYNLNNFGYYIKNTNLPIFDLVNEQLDSMREIIEQLSLAIEYSKKQIDFINKHNHGIARKGKYIAEIRSSFKDFEVFLENYEHKQSFNFHLLSKKYSDRFNEVEKLIGDEEIREGRIRKHIKLSKFIPTSKRLGVFNAKDELEKTFDLFELTKIDEQLYQILHPYISDESWNTRYEEPVDESENSKDSAKPKSGKKPKLIDFEEDDAISSNQD